jgi:ADP-ribose pyrophosphatase
MPDEELLQTRRFRVVRRVFTTLDGATHAREIILHPGAVTIVPMLDDGRVCLTRNRRVAVDDTLIELPAGTREPGEDPAETARRELEEETGYQAAEIRHLHDFWMSPGILRERMHLFVATGLVRKQVRLDLGEQIEPLVVAWDEAMAMAFDGRIQDAKTLVGLLYYDRGRRLGLVP